MLNMYQTQKINTRERQVASHRAWMIPPADTHLWPGLGSCTMHAIPTPGVWKLPRVEDKPLTHTYVQPPVQVAAEAPHIELVQQLRLLVKYHSAFSPAQAVGHSKMQPGAAESPEP